MRSSQLTDDDLWRVIAANTDAMSVLIEKQFEQAIDNYDRQYRDCIAEIRRRYPSI